MDFTMHFKTITKLGVVALGSAMLLAACGNSSSQTSRTNTLNWMSNTSVTTLDPSKAVDVTSDQVLYNSMRGLVTPDKGNKVNLAMAKNYKITNGGKTYTFNLRHSKWSNGKEVTAKDFEYGIKRSADPKTASQMGYYMNNIMNYSSIKNQTMPASMLGVKATGKYQLQIQLIKPQADFLNVLALPVFYPQLKSAVDQYGSSYGTTSDKMVYNGPFKVTNWTGSNDAWTLAKNNDYYANSNVKLKAINYSVIKDPQTALDEYQSGKLDQTLVAGKQQYNNYKNNPDLVNRKEFMIQYLSINQNRVPALKNKNLRRALSMAIDRKSMTEDILGDGSFAARGLVPDTLAYKKGKDFNDYASVKDATSTDLTQAKKLWNQGMKEVGKKSLSISIMNNNDQTNRSLTEFLQTELEKLPGLKVNAEILPNNVASGRSLKSDYDLSVSGWSPSVSDPISPLQTKVSNSPINTSKWGNSMYDMYIDRSNNQDATNPSKRFDDLVNAQKIILNDQGIIPLYQKAQPELIKENVKGIKYLGNGPVWDFANAYIKK
ncbi:peptide ABC transporter substrate-binding protein [Apilactobacillus bombintestini]|uniref:Peptide ABC transporter substrate-binding protein n=1 Tax=Apilactobacillus bombintestini TaxID=2419772 RepID=A0A387ANA4_9LACO|nr:peptide ABC transporter substrate-binding protein [Apilactobacillus bombintestini]AYF92154.1 peptide ABC transporter substrate-binding protein [Apilactobacillus bombintestini]